jgi:hypothetical protein
MKFLTLILACLTTICVQAELFFTPQMIATHLETYTDKEVQLIEKDLSVVRSVCLGGTCNTDSRFYLATAGGPGARKTTILEKFVATHPEYAGGVYLDPDLRALKFMAHTYYAQSLNSLVVSQNKDYDQVIKNAYNQWRPGSNYIALTLFEEAVAAGRSIIYGTTSTGAHIPNFFAKLKKNGYKVVLLLCSCPDHLRQEATEYRNQVVRFYQCSPEDAVAKGKIFPQRMGAYFAHADLMYLYWSDDLFSPEKLAAVWRDGKLEEHDKEALKRFVEKYEADRLTLAAEGQIIPAFETYISKQ